MWLKSRLATRLVFWMGGVATLIFALGIFIDYRISRAHIIRNSELEAAEVIRDSVSDLRALFQAVQSSTDLFARVLGDRNLSPEEMRELLQRAVAKNDELYGATIALAPEHSGHAGGFAPYYYHDAGDALAYADLSQTYPRGYVNEPWFSLPQREGSAIWSEPYFDAGGGKTLMTTYSVPILRKQGEQAQFFGVVTADITLKSIQAYLNRIRLGGSGFAFLLSEQGSLISYPDDRYLLQTFPAVFPAISNDQGWQQAIFHALEGRREIVRVTCPHQRGQCLLAYSPFGETGWALLVVYPEEEMLAELNHHMLLVMGLGALCVVALLLSVVLIARSITRPLVLLTAAADRLGEGNMDVTLPAVQRDDEIAHLVTAFRHMKLRLRAYVTRVELDAASRNRLQGELDAARQIQMEMLPQAGDALVQLPAYDIHARLIPAKAVGGDLYTWFRPDDRHVFLVIGDVSDKGVPAALFMARVVTLLQQQLVSGTAPEAVLDLLNDDLVQRNDACMFATLCCVRIDLETGVMDWASAGHSPPLLRRAAGAAHCVEILAQEHGPALGLMEAQDFPANRLQLQPGDILLLCTDGIDEAMNPAHELFGVEGVQKTLQQSAGGGVQDIGRQLLQAVRDHAGEEPQSDDITLLVFAWLEAWCREHGVPAAVQHDLKLVAEEVFANIVHYGGLPRTAQVVMQLARDAGAVGMEFIDAGKPWNPLQDTPAPELGVATDEVEIGGLGVHLVRELTDGQLYRRGLSENRFCVMKQL